ncbi:MAG: BMP family ABC transporter substrate-binding protein [Bacillota bacterium]|nr:BMP family ABC transporter substrate-binding protein [Bacillota bacterium]
MKKFLAFLLILTLCLTVFAGCGGDTEEPVTEDPGTEEGEAAEPLKIGFIYIGVKNDGGYTQAHADGAAAMAEYFGDAVEIIEVESVDDGDQQASYDAAVSLIDQGCKVIVGCSFGFMYALDELANSGDYDDITFLHFSGNSMNETNFANYFGSIEEARYLCGMVAGAMTESNQLGYVAAYPYTEVQIGINAFTLGAQSVNPDVEVNVVYINSWYDPEMERSAADELLAAGCDVITQHCDTTGPQIAAEEAGAYAIFYNSDNNVAPNAYLTAAIWNHEVYLIDQIQQIMDGTWAPTSYYGTMADGYVDLAPFTDLVPEDVVAQVEEVKAQMLAGEFAPFSGPIEYNDSYEGADEDGILCEEGQTLTRAEIWSIDGLVQGAE